MSINTDMLRDIASFLVNDKRFSAQVKELDKVIEYFDKKSALAANLPTADQIWSIIDEDLDWPYEITLDAPLGCTLKVVTVGDDVYVDFYDNQTGASATSCHFLFWNEDMTSADIEKHCQEYDYWADHFEFVEQYMTIAWLVIVCFVVMVAVLTIGFLCGYW